MGGYKKQKNKVEIKKYIAIVAFLITLVLFLSFVILGNMLDEKREKFLNSEFSRLYRDINDIQTITLVSQLFDEKFVCIALQNKLMDMNKYIWNLGQRIDRYRAATEEFTKDEFYIEQKTKFNEQEMIYFLLMRNIIQKCNITKELVLFFYKNSDECKKCEDQSFILTDIKETEDKMKRDQIAVFSFDMDLNISTVKMLSDYYNINPNELPCIVIGKDKYCGIQDKDRILDLLCKRNNLTICTKYKSYTP